MHIKARNIGWTRRHIGWAAFAAMVLLASVVVAQAEASDEEWIEHKSGLKYVDLAVGDGPEARGRSFVQVHYTGWLEDGTQFDSSKTPGRSSFGFQMGQGQVIKGWELGVKGMKVGGKRKLWIPFKLAYGKRGVEGRIPSKSNLIFEIELIGAR